MKSSSILNRRGLFHRVLGLVLMLALVGGSPGIFENLSQPAYGQNTPFADEPIKVEVSTQEIIGTDSAHIALETVEAPQEDDQVEAAAKKEMHKAEEIAWSIARALLPTLGVMAFSAAVVMPLAWVVVGAVVVGAATAGILSFTYEQRKNSFRSEEDKKPIDRIMRDVTVSAAVSGAMAPFSMLTAGFAQAVGPITAKAIIRTAAKMGAVSFLGSTVSNVTKSAVTNLWYHHYYNYGERENMLKQRIETLSAIPDRTDRENQDLAAAIKEFDEITSEKYSMEDFHKDQKRALVSAGISGVLGGAAGRFAATSDWAKIASSKLFGSTAHAGTVANAVVSNPFAFATGSSNAAIDKKDLLKQIENNRTLQSKYEPGTPPFEYYEQKIADLETAYTNLNIWRSGRDAMVSNAAMQSAVVLTSLAKTRVLDIPSKRRKQVQADYEEQDPDWQKASEARQELEIMRGKQPVASEYENRSEYYSALRAYARDLNNLQDEYQRLKVVAANNQSLPQNKARLGEITAQVDKKMEYARQEQLARALGQESFVEFKLEQIKRDPEFQELSEAELVEMAHKKVGEAFEDSARANANRLAQMQEKVDGRERSLEGVIERGPEGQRVIAVKDENGQTIATKPWEGGNRAYWFQKLVTKDPNKLHDAEIERAVREVYDSASMVKPSSYRNTFVNMRVDQLRAQGMNDKQIEQYLPEIVSEANADTVATFGGSWENVVKGEMLAAGLERARYNDGEAPDIHKILNFLRGELPNQTVSLFKKELGTQVKNVIPNVEIGSLQQSQRIKDERTLRDTADRLLNQNLGPNHPYHPYYRR